MADRKKRYTNKMALFIVLLVIFLLVAICLTYLLFYKKPTALTVAYCKTLSSQSPAEGHSSPEFVCFKKILESKSDPRICNEFKNEHDAVLCVGYLYQWGWLKPGDFDSEMCGAISRISVRDECYYWIGRFGTDINVCNKVVNSEKKSACLGSIAFNLDDVSLCNSVPVEIGNGQSHLTDSHRKCIYNFFQGEDVVADCSSLDNERLRDLCYDSMAYSNKTSRGGEYCSYIIDQNSRDGCYNDIGRMTIDSVLCEKITSNKIKQECWDSYNSRMAHKTKNDKYCEKIIDEKLRSKCFD